ncbi:MAG: nucleotidyl transferase AbiEii/AbiGii toxin family protein [Gammaproteobacteria bacterium]|nr:nucleotidyl transferase AbiEii/AbiGii toxin family protein [Gammaproteobacteria bacterium]
MPGLKVELVYIPLRCRLQQNTFRSENLLPAVDVVEIAAGKWQALAARLPERGDSYPDLVRHIHDLSSLLLILEGNSVKFQKAALRNEVTEKTIRSVVEEVGEDAWKNHYASYMRRMGTAEIADLPRCHPTWKVVTRGFSRTAELLLNRESTPDADQ